jgi:hypothetical protein
MCERDRPVLTPAQVEAGVSALHDSAPWMLNGSSWEETVRNVHAAICGGEDDCADDTESGPRRSR